MKDLRTVRRDLARGEVLASKFDGSDICRRTSGRLFQRDGTAMAMERFANVSDEVTGGRRSVRLEEERVERSGRTVNN